VPLNIDISQQDKLQKFLARRHPEYVNMLPHWTFCEETYEGGRHWFRGNIFRYVKEGDGDYSDRVKRAYRFPHTKEVVDLIQKYIFKSPVQRNHEDVPDYVNQFWKSTTLSNLNIDQFIRLAGEKSSVFGRVWIFVDSTKKDTVLTKSDEEAAGARCYAHVVSPRDVLDIGFTEDGRLTWMLVREYVRDDKDPITSSGIVKERYRLWTTDSWALFEIQDNAMATPEGTVKPVTNFDMLPPAASAAMQLTLPGVEPYIASTDLPNKVYVKLVDQGEVTIGRVPCFPLDNVIGDHKYFSPALINDVAYLDRAVANYLSNLDAIIQDQTFSQLAMPAQNLLPGDDKYEALREMGTKRVFLYDGEGGAVPMYLSPDPRQAQMIVTVINKIIGEIYHSVGVGAQRTSKDNAVGTDDSSGVAKAYDFERLNSLLVSKSETLENAEKAIIELVALWNGDEPDKLIGTLDDPKETQLVKYADTFDVRSLYDEFTVAERLELIDAPKTVRQEQMKQFINKLFPTLANDLKKKMLEDVERWPITGIDQVEIDGVMNGNPSAQFPARLTSKTNPGMQPMPQPAPATAAGGGKTAKKASKGKTAKSKNPQTQSRQGQVTSET